MALWAVLMIFALLSLLLLLLLLLLLSFPFPLPLPLPPLRPSYFPRFSKRRSTSARTMKASLRHPSCGVPTTPTATTTRFVHKSETRTSHLYAGRRMRLSRIPGRRSITTSTPRFRSIRYAHIERNINKKTDRLRFIYMYTRCRIIPSPAKPPANAVGLADALSFFRATPRQPQTPCRCVY